MSAVNDCYLHHSYYVSLCNEMSTLLGNFPVTVQQRMGLRIGFYIMGTSIFSFRSRNFLNQQYIRDIFDLDLNPLNFFVWRYLKNEVYLTKILNLEYFERIRTDLNNKRKEKHLNKRSRIGFDEAKFAFKSIVKIS